MKEKQTGITSFDVLPNGTLKPSSLLRYMQQIAREDCDGLGCTYRYMRSHNTVFVLTQIGLRIYAPLYTGDTLLLRTYNDGVNGLIFDRGFEIESGGKPAGICSSRWVLVRYDTRALVRPRDFPFSFECLHRQAETVAVPRRFESDGARYAGERTVRLSDLDENNHLNNCVYADIAMDADPDADGISGWFSGARINFRHEARRGDVLELSVADSEEGRVVFARNKTADAPCFEAELSFTPFS